jgi:hypothetical protein
MSAAKERDPAGSSKVTKKAVKATGDEQLVRMYVLSLIGEAYTSVED